MGMAMCVPVLVRAEEGDSGNDTAGDEADSSSVLEADEVYETVVRGYRILPTDETTGFARTIEVSTEAVTMTTVSDVLSEAVGVQVRRLGGLGSYGAASIRGSTPGQVPVFLDGVQLNTGGYPSVDLGDFNLDTLGELEVYRGTAPVYLGTSGIGGAVLLKTRSFDSPRTEISTSYGSWNSWRLMALHGSTIGSADALAIMTAQGSDGDFEYLNDNGTLHNADDDRFERRRNNEHVAYGNLVKLEGPVADWRYSVFNDFYMKRQGTPGLGNVPTQDASLRTLRDTVTLRFRRPVEEQFGVDVETSYTGMREDFDDSGNEIGIGHQHTLSHSDAAGLSVSPLMEWNSENSTMSRLGTRYEAFYFEELLQDIESGTKWRVRTEFGLQHDWSPWDLLLVSPAIRLEVHNARYGGGRGPAGAGELEAGSVDDFFWSPSLGARLEVLKGFFLRANAGRYVRAPDIAELFGDRGAVVGNPELGPEVGINTDAGFTWLNENRGALSLVRLDAAWFGAWVEDLIAYVQNSQNTVRPENIDDAQILGAEASLRTVFFNVLAVEGNYTYLYGINQSDKPYHRGKRLPGRPEHEAFAKIEVRRDFDLIGASMWMDTDYAGSNYLDQANFKQDTLARLFFGAGLRISHHASGFSLTLQAKNIFDKITARDEDGRLRQIRDFEGFPLPGRAIFATLHWKSSDTGALYP